jgi:hypothetical protein
VRWVLPLALALTPFVALSGDLRSNLAAATEEVRQGQFERALKILGHPDPARTKGPDAARVHLLRAQCYAALRQHGQMEAALKDALASDPRAAYDADSVSPDLVEALEELRGELKGHLSIGADIPGWLARVDGRPFGPVPLQVEIKAGEHSVTLTDPDGQRTLEQKAVVTAGEQAEVSFDTSLAPAAETPAPRHADAPVRHKKSKEVSLTPSVAAPAFPPRTWTYVATGSTAVAMGTAMTLGVLADSARNSLLSQQHSQSVAQGYHDQAAGLATGANVAWSVAAVAGVTAVVLFLLQPNITGPRS